MADTLEKLGKDLDKATADYDRAKKKTAAAKKKMDKAAGKMFGEGEGEGADGIRRADLLAFQAAEEDYQHEQVKEAAARDAYEEALRKYFEGLQKTIQKAFDKIARAFR